MVAESSKMSMEKTSEDLTDVMWSDPQWLSQFPLNESTALTYFSLSQFYDARCNNNQLNMQRMDHSLLKTMEGIEYSQPTSPCPGLFIITKSYRTLKPNAKLDTLAYYYIHEGRIYQAPTIHSILSTRLLQSFHHLKKGFQLIKSSAVLSATQGEYIWDGDGNNDDGRLGGHHAGGADDIMSSGERKAVGELLYDVWEKNNAISKQQQEKQQ